MKKKVRKRANMGGKKTGLRAATEGKKFKKGGCSSHRRHASKASTTVSSSSWTIDTNHTDAETQAFYAEMTLLPSPTVGQRLRCGLNIHGENARRRKIMWIDQFGNKSNKDGSMNQYFCVSCGKEWTE